MLSSNLHMFFGRFVSLKRLISCSRRVFLDLYGFIKRKLLALRTQGGWVIIVCFFLFFSSSSQCEVWYGTTALLELSPQPLLLTHLPLSLNYFYLSKPTPSSSSSPSSSNYLSDFICH
ncbi:hypothetical protein RIF29_36948 [Crotalaria pallida]|uniref:Uncharacterized protein n=1 Tax=Crotalaria pallida TaxID=3830 RepID=A0AAN9EBQ2_CROPI